MSRSTIDITPKWSDLIPVLAHLIQNGSDSARATAIAELQRLACAVDAMNAAARKERENRNAPKADPVEGLAIAMRNTYRADALRMMAKALETAMDDSHHFAKDSDDGGAERARESSALSTLAHLVALAIDGTEEMNQ